MRNYDDFIRTKTQWAKGDGIACESLPSFLFDFQAYLVDWALRRGRSAIFADCGLGKTAMELAWAQQVIKQTNKPVLLVTPIAVGAQVCKEGEKFGIEARRSRDGSIDQNKCVWVTNYEQLHKFDPSLFSGVVCDESSAIKDFKSQRKATVVEFMRTIPYRLLCTATAAPNDFWELGTSSEALGLLGFRDMITTFFRQETSKDHHGWGRTKYRFRGHAEQPFWSWVCSWARACQSPNDLGFDGSRFVLPELREIETIVQSAKLRSGFLFALPAKDMQEEREERRRTIKERVEYAAHIASKVDGPCVLWCELNAEGKALREAIPGSVEISGSCSDDEKEEALIGFSCGDIDRLITKPKIGAWGLNWQHCSDVVIFPSHSFEQYYQAVRRCWRFGQVNPVNVSLVISEGEAGIVRNLRRKQAQVNRMFESLCCHMRDAMHLATTDFFPETERVPQWLA